MIQTKRQALSMILLIVMVIETLYIAIFAITHNSNANTVSIPHHGLKIASVSGIHSEIYYINKGIAESSTMVAYESDIAVVSEKPVGIKQYELEDGEVIGPEYIFTFTEEAFDAPVTKYTTTSVNVRTEPRVTDESKIDTFRRGKEVTVTGKAFVEDDEWYQIEYTDGTTAYMFAEYLSDEKPVVQVAPIYNTSWDGTKLNKRNGTIQGPSGKETYYNLKMDGVIRIMRRMGNNDEYWIREDGVKMLGDYVMIAANLDLRPRGSLVETSLGLGIVCDTGGFAKNNPTQIDIAVAW